MAYGLPKELPDVLVFTGGREPGEEGRNIVSPDLILLLRED